MRIPRRRTWYRNDNGAELGTDVLTGYETLDQEDNGNAGTSD